VGVKPPSETSRVSNIPQTKGNVRNNSDIVAVMPHDLPVQRFAFGPRKVATLVTTKYLHRPMYEFYMKNDNGSALHSHTYIKQKQVHSKSFDIRHWMVRKALLTGNCLRGPLDVNIMI
jgi:hypothetical protein